MSPSSDFVSSGQSALAKANWLEAKKQFEKALREADTPEARDGLGLALWWLNEISASHEQRTLAYLGYKASEDLPKAARLAAWLAREQVFLRANVSAMNGWFARAQRLLAEIEPCSEIGWVKIYQATMTASPEEQEQSCGQKLPWLAWKGSAPHTMQTRTAAGNVDSGEDQS